SRHARIFPQDGQWIVEDLGSTNGTYLDRQKVTRPMPVPVGVPIRIGKTVLELRRCHLYSATRYVPTSGSSVKVTRTRRMRDLACSRSRTGWAGMPRVRWPAR